VPPGGTRRKSLARASELRGPSLLGVVETAARGLLVSGVLQEHAQQPLARFEEAHAEQKGCGVAP